MTRILDILIAGAVFIGLLPVFLVLMIAIMLDSKGNPIFSQQRVGRKGRLFDLYKFRSMVQGAPQLGGYSTMPGDARITRMGRIIRATSLDELPQLWNVIVGDMSLVGPRPDVPHQEQLYRPEDWQKRLSVRPGITGLAQVTKRSTATPEERLALDLQYVEDPSVMPYIRIMLKTLRLVLTKLAY